MTEQCPGRVATRVHPRGIWTCDLCGRRDRLDDRLDIFVPDYTSDVTGAYLMPAHERADQ